MVQVTLKHPLINGGTEVRVLCESVSVSGNAQLEVKPNMAQSTAHEPVEAQKISTENLRYILDGIDFTNAAGTLKYIDVLTMYKSRFAEVDDTTYPEVELRVQYGTTALVSGTMSVNQATQSTVINVLLDSFSYPINARDTKDGYIPKGSITLIETA